MPPLSSVWHGMRLVHMMSKLKPAEGTPDPNDSQAQN
jgi:hypothetical protein